MVEGYDAPSFSIAEKAAFSSGLATLLSLSPVAVQVTDVVPVASSTQRRRLLGSTSPFVDVVFAATSSASSAVALLSAMRDDATELTGVLRSAGLVQLVSVAVHDPSIAAQTGAGPPPRLGVITLTPASRPVNPSVGLLLYSNVTSAAPSTLRLLWSQLSGPPLAFNDTSLVGTPLNSSTLGLLPGALLPGSVYKFQLKAADDNGSGYAEVSVPTLALPAGGMLTVSPSNGTALVTPFTLNTTAWTDANANNAGFPLLYAFSYAVINAFGSAVWLSPFSVQPSLSSVLLPAGTLELRVVARNAFGGIAAAPATARVTVQAPVFVSAAAEGDFYALVAANASALNNSATSVAIVTGAALMLNNASSTLLNMDPARAAIARTELLLSITSAASAATTTVAVGAVASAVSALVSNSSQLSGVGANAALSLLRNISISGTDERRVTISNETGYTIAAGLSSIATAAQSPNNTAVNASVLGRVFGVVNLLAASQLAQLTVPGSPRLVVSSPQIQMSVSLDNTGPGSRLYSQPFTAPGSSSSFSPLHSSTFSGRSQSSSGSVRSQFASLAFDPFTRGDNNKGVTRLAFSDTNGAELPVENLTAPVYFSLPPLDALGDGVKAQCAFWDTAAAVPAYSTKGCTGLPDPRPPNHTVGWIPDFELGNDADIVLSWGIVGSLSDENCSVAVLDCSLDNPGFVHPNRAFPLLVPKVECDRNTSTSPMRVYLGSRCLLIQSDNELNCSWSNSKQAFVGAGCVASGGPVQCTCRHLTDFAGSSKASLPMCSLSDMVGLNPADIVTKLRVLFIVVMTLFGTMSLGAGVGVVLDIRERRRFVRRLQSARAGFRVAEDGTWVWRFSLKPMPDDDELHAPTGSAVTLCELFGVPVTRICAALPDEMLPFGFADAVGRRNVFSREGMTATWRAQHAPPEALGQERTTTVDPVSTVVDSDLCEDEDFADVLMEEFVGTALVLAFLQAASLLPVVELAQRKSAAAAYFDGVETPAGWDWAHTQTDFVTLVGPGTLNTKSKWLLRARLFKLIFSQSPDGFWDCSMTTAFALEARSAKEVEELKPTLLLRIRTVLGSLAEAGLEDDDDDGAGRRDGDGAGDVLVDAIDPRVSREELPDDMRGVADEHPSTGPKSLRRLQSISRAQKLLDCPLSCSPNSIREAMPRRLAKVRSAHPDIDVLRVWTTMCCISMLERLKWCWLWGDGELYPPEERTIVDAAREWIEAYAKEHAPLADALEDGALQKRAAQVTLKWRRACEQRVAELRRSEAIRAQMNNSHVHRTLVGVVRALVTQHDTFATFLSEPLDGLQRWQMFVILISLVCSQLLVNIWMFYAKAVNCCAEVRLILDSGPDEGPDAGRSCPPVGPCRGYEGNCGDLAMQFWDMPVLPNYPYGLQDWYCAAFPNDESTRDSFLVGLISIAVALPCLLFLATCFAIANDNEAPESWLEWTGLFTWQKLVFGLNAHRRWHYTRGKQPVRYVKWFIRSVGAPKSETFINLIHSLVAFVRGTDPPWIEEWKEAQGELSDDGSEHEHGNGAAAPADEEAEPPQSSPAQTRASAVLEWGGVYANALYDDTHGATGAANGETPTKPARAAEALPGGGMRFEQLMLAAHVAPASFSESSGGDGHEAENGHAAGALSRQSSSSAGSTSSSVRSAKALAKWKRQIMAAGVVGTVITWALFVWFIFTYGMLIYKLLGDEAQSSFARSWGISYAMDAVTQWKEIAKEAVKGAIILAILEYFSLTPAPSWLEEHVDWLCVQALFTQQTLTAKSLSVTQKVRLFYEHTKRVCD